MATQEEIEEAVRKEHLDTQEKHAEIMRTLWRHENDLMSTRLTFFVAVQILIFTALTFAWKSQTELLAVLMCIMGVVTAISTLRTFSLGHDAWFKLGDWWKNKLENYQGPPMTGNYEHPVGNKIKMKLSW